MTAGQLRGVLQKIVEVHGEQVEIQIPVSVYGVRKNLITRIYQKQDTGSILLLGRKLVHDEMNNFLELYRGDDGQHKVQAKL